MTTNSKQGLIALAFIATFVIGMFAGGAYITPFEEQNTAINSLKGNNPYSMEIIYKTHVVELDTSYTVDTLFVKKKEIKNV